MAEQVRGTFTLKDTKDYCLYQEYNKYYYFDKNTWAIRTIDIKDKEKLLKGKVKKL